LTAFYDEFKSINKSQPAQNMQVDVPRGVQDAKRKSNFGGAPREYVSKLVWYFAGGCDKETSGSYKDKIKVESI